MGSTIVGSRPRYRQAELLGEDRLGTLWSGTDLWSGTPVALRLLDERSLSSPAAVHRATSQLRAVQRDVSNPHVAKVLDFDLSPRRHQPAFVVFEGPAGETLAGRLKRRTALPVHEALRLIAGVADGLAAAHAARIYHSVLGPSSVLADDVTVKVIDFGLAELAGGHEEHGRNTPATNLRDRGPADVLAVGLLFEQLRGETHPSSLHQNDAPRGREDVVERDAVISLRRARSPYWSQRPHMAELAATLAPALESAPLLEGEEHDRGPVRLDSVAPAPVAPPAPARPAAAETSATAPAKEPTRARPAAAQTPAETPARPAAAKTPAKTPARPAAVKTPAKEPARPAAAKEPARPAAAEMPARPTAAGTRPTLPAEEPVGSGRAVRRRARVLVAAAAVAAVAIGVVILRPSSDPPGEERSAPPSSGVAATASPSIPASGVIVPDVLGLSAMEAGRVLAQAGLVVSDADPVPGAPGQVVGTDPPSSEVVDPGTPITLLVGASPERLENGPGDYAFTAPSSWELREVGPLAEVVSPNGDIVITFEPGARGSLEVASERHVASLLETRSNSELIGQRRELIGDSRSLLVSGTASEDTGEAIRFLAITVRGEPRNYAITIVVPARSNPEQVLPRIEEIVTSFRTLDAEDP